MAARRHPLCFVGREQAHGRRTKGAAPTSGARPRDRWDRRPFATGRLAFHRQGTQMRNACHCRPLELGHSDKPRTSTASTQIFTTPHRPPLHRRGERSGMAKRPPDPPRGRSDSHFPAGSSARRHAHAEPASFNRLHVMSSYDATAHRESQRMAKRQVGRRPRCSGEPFHRTPCGCPSRGCYPRSSFSVTPHRSFEPLLGPQLGKRSWPAGGKHKLCPCGRGGAEQRKA